VAEWSAVYNAANTGKSLDEIVESGDSLWYPQVWPIPERGMESKLDSVAEHKLNGAKTKVMEEILELFAPKQPVNLDQQ